MGAAQNVPKTQLAVAGGIGVPIGQRLENLGQPRSLGDEGSESDIGHLVLVEVDEVADVRVEGLWWYVQKWVLK